MSSKKPPPAVSGVYVKVPVPPELAELVAPHIERARVLFGELLGVAAAIAEESEAVKRTARKLRKLPRARRKK